MKNNNSTTALATVFLLIFSTPGQSQGVNDGASLNAPGDKALSTTYHLSPHKAPIWLQSATIQPKMMQGSDGGNAALGFTYEFSTKPIVKDMTPATPIGGSPPPDGSKVMAFELTAKGTYAARAEVNPEKSIDLAASGSWLYIINGLHLKSAFSGAYEAQQGNSTRAKRWELSQEIGTWLTKPGILQIPQNTEILSHAAVARINPSNDPARSAALGTDLHDYNRWEFEIVGIVPINVGTLKKIELRHLRFQEIGASNRIKAVGLDRSHLTSIYFGLTDGLFVAFSRGGVPADRRESQLLQLGWTTNIH